MIGINKVCNGKAPYYGKKNCEKFIWSFVKLSDNVEPKNQ